MSIGSRQSAAGTEYDNQFNGNINDVSIYNYALSTSQVQAHYFASGVVPFITQQPADTTVNEGSSAHFTVTALGTMPLAYQWYDVGAGNSPIAGATTSSLTLPNLRKSSQRSIPGWFSLPIKMTRRSFGNLADER